MAMTLTPQAIEAIKASLRASIALVQAARHDHPPLHDYQAALTELENQP